MDIGSHGIWSSIEEEYTSKNKLLSKPVSASQDHQDSICGWTKLDLLIVTRKKNPHYGTVRYFNKMILE